MMPCGHSALPTLPLGRSPGQSPSWRPANLLSRFEQEALARYDVQLHRARRAGISKWRRVSVALSIVLNTMPLQLATASLFVGLALAAEQQSTTIEYASYTINAQGDVVGRTFHCTPTCSYDFLSATEADAPTDLLGATACTTRGFAPLKLTCASAPLYNASDNALAALGGVRGCSMNAGVSFQAMMITCALRWPPANTWTRTFPTVALRVVLRIYCSPQHYLFHQRIVSSAARAGHLLF